MSIHPKFPTIPVTVRPQIGSLEVIQRNIVEGLTISEIAAELGPSLPITFWSAGIVTVDDDLEIDRSVWTSYRPRQGQCVQFHCSFGKDSPTFQMIAGIAIVAAQAFAYAIPGVGPFVSAAIGLAGGLFLSYLAQSGQKSGSKKAPKQLGEGGFAQNALSPYEQFATVLGTRRVPAPYIAPPFVEIANEDVNGYAIIGLAGRHELSDAYANGAPIDIVEERYAEGDESDLPPSIYDEIVWQEMGTALVRHSLDIDVSTDELFDLRNSGGTTEELQSDTPKFQWFRLGDLVLPRTVRIDLKFPMGLARADGADKGGTAFQLVLKKKDGTLIYLPEIWALANIATAFRARIELRFFEDPGTGTAPSSSNLWFRACYDSVNQSAWGYTPDAYYDPGSPGNSATHVAVTTSTRSCRIYVDPAQMAIEPGMSLGIRQGCGVYSGRITAAAGTYNFKGGAAQTLNWFDYHTTDEVMEDQAKVISDAEVSYVTRYYDEEAPLNTEGIAFYEFQNTNGHIDNITILASKYVNWKWNGVEWSAEPHTSDNPAEQAYDIMRNNIKTLNARALSTVIINDAEFGDWKEYCDTNGLTVSAFITGGSIEEALALCFVAGNAYLKRSQKWGVYIEKDRSGETPVQVFSPRNCAGFQIDKIFEYKPHALRVTYDNKDDGWQTAPDLIVYAPGYNADGSSGLTRATLFESIDFRSVDQEWQAAFLAGLQLKIAKYRNKTYSLETDARYLASPRGSLVGVNHYVISGEHGHAAVRRVKRQVVGGVTMIVGLELDGYVDMQPATTGFAITSYNSSIVTAQSTQPGRTNDIVFSTPIANDTEIDEGCTVTLGVVGEEYLRCIVDDVQPGANGTAKLILVDEAPEIFT